MNNPIFQIITGDSKADRLLMRRLVVPMRISVIKDNKLNKMAIKTNRKQINIAPKNIDEKIRKQMHGLQNKYTNASNYRCSFCNNDKG